ncbi:MAG: 4Fe-4S dicluster domain-containing protein, partial [Alphaproteobacteria bacterium]|nr:4Fe-4S dicluster domain-containing protein [Alphaproteobacteria bacterium]
MQTHFDLNALARPEISTADEILRKCVHCGFCTATCPTYVLTGDERDSPRGRIWMMRDLLGGGDKQTEIKAADVSYHLDRCLTCLSCMTTCPSGVDYMHLVDIGRAEINKKIRRGFADHVIRTLLSITVPFARRFHLALRFARLAKPFSGLLTGRLKAMVNLSPTRLQALDKV